MFLRLPSLPVCFSLRYTSVLTVPVPPTTVIFLDLALLRTPSTTLGVSFYLHLQALHGIRVSRCSAYGGADGCSISRAPSSRFRPPARPRRSLVLLLLCLAMARRPVHARCKYVAPSGKRCSTLVPLAGALRIPRGGSLPFFCPHHQRNLLSLKTTRIGSRVLKFRGEYTWPFPGRSSSKSRQSTSPRFWRIAPSWSFGR